jgi:hypothetical protein
MKTYSLIGTTSKLIKLNNAEIQILEHLQQGAGISEQAALRQVVSYKREQVLVQEAAGNYALVELLLKELDDWNDQIEARLAGLKESHKPPPKIYIP